MTAIEIIGSLFGSSIFVTALAHSVRLGLPAIANARLTRAEAALKEKEAAKADAERKRIEAERDRDWMNDTGKIITTALDDQRSNLQHERAKADAAQKGEADCVERLNKLDAECKARDAANQEVLRAQRHETKNVRSALQLLLASAEVTKSIPPEAVAAAKVQLEHDATKAAPVESKP